MFEGGPAIVELVADSAARTAEEESHADLSCFAIATAIAGVVGVAGVPAIQNGPAFVALALSAVVGHLAVAFEKEVSPIERLELRISLTGDLIDALGTDNVDVADLDTIHPEIGLSALRTGRVLLGTHDTIEEYRDRFERETTVDDETHKQRMRRFDSILEHW